MKKSLSDFAKTPIAAKAKPTPASSTINTEQDLQTLLEQYQKMPQDELMKNFYQQVAMQKQNGTFDLAKLESALNGLDAFLLPEQKKNIKEILNKL